MRALPALLSDGAGSVLLTNPSRNVRSETPPKGDRVAPHGAVATVFSF
jgi:hypothetical protein